MTTKSCGWMVNSNNIVVQDLPHHPKVKGLSSVEASSIGTEKTAINVDAWISNDSDSVVEQSWQHLKAQYTLVQDMQNNPEVKGLSLVEACWYWERQNGTIFYASMVNSNKTVVEDMPNNPEVKGLSPATATGTKRQKMAKTLMHGRLKVVG